MPISLRLFSESILNVSASNKGSPNRFFHKLNQFKSYVTEIKASEDVSKFTTEASKNYGMRDQPKSMESRRSSSRAQPLFHKI